ncbi:hypothetical protein Golax_011387 [Gossypium laxum]|uniref:Uncharacterized protein n=1 Tax=Gossypium laxum TaxID=34288 RepID=A0A7J8ZKR6_9ROSI|nr:hypothetical protein [Gossypium laxum]
MSGIIDQVVVLDDEALKFDDTWVNFALKYFEHHLQKLKLNYRPLLVATYSTASFVGNWNVSTEVVANTKGFTDAMQEWNKKVFGNIFARKNELMTNLRKVQRSLELQGNSSLRSYKIDLKTAIEDILEIQGLRIEGMGWCYDEDMLKQHAIKFYLNLYMIDVSPPTKQFFYRGRFPALDNDDLGVFNAKVSIDEVRKAFYSMDLLKAPGADGLHAKFYQS